MAGSISPFVTAGTKFSFCSSNKKCSFFLSSLALDLCHPFSRWASFSCRLLSLFLCLSLAPYSKFVDMTINLSLILHTTGYRNNFRFPFSSLLTLWMSLLYNTRVAMRLPTKITSSCIWVAIPVDWVILHWCACGADGRSFGRCTVTWLPNFLGWIDFLTHGALLRARKSSAIICQHTYSALLKTWLNFVIMTYVQWFSYNHTWSSGWSLTRSRNAKEYVEFLI